MANRDLPYIEYDLEPNWISEAVVRTLEHSARVRVMGLPEIPHGKLSPVMRKLYDEMEVQQQRRREWIYQVTSRGLLSRDVAQEVAD